MFLVMFLTSFLCLDQYEVINDFWSVCSGVYENSAATLDGNEVTVQIPDPGLAWN